MYGEEINKYYFIQKGKEIKNKSSISVRGCLYNVRRDPSESHDLWQRAPNIAALLTARLRGLWAQQLRRGPIDYRNESDPANYGYVWTPWINEFSNNVIPIDRNINNLNFSLNYSVNKTTQANAINCNGTTGFRNFLCLLRSVF